ncbi:DUF6969 family protein [Candidatus Neptunichlamydia sp. REUL1]|uniref:DUF6969 family protein n=1 Tax=Candidatus Neptunichlamydia sp. REUL1 TaxID=3064277 RepID=UPI00292FC7BA|nr:hypothetical protein [Candidatus Neptunochlamydia sp. REUL1]
MKRLRTTLTINLIGLTVLFVCLFGYQGITSGGTSFPHQNVVIDTSILKNELNEYSRKDLEKMLHAGEEILEWNEMLSKTESHVVDQVLKRQGVLWELDHCPMQDTFDRETYSQYYYHAHRKGEHGHFHLFLRQGGMEKDTFPIFYDARNDTLNDIDTYAHLIAISMDDEGYPLALFTTNRWVTGEDWYTSRDVKKMVDRFRVNHAHPSYVVNRWLNAMLILFRPQIDRLIEERETALERYANGIPIKKVLEDHELDITSEMPISLKKQIEVIRTQGLFIKKTLQRCR